MISTERGNYRSRIPNSPNLAERRALRHLLHCDGLDVDVGGVAELELQRIL